MGARANDPEDGDLTGAVVALPLGVTVEDCLSLIDCVPFRFAAKGLEVSGLWCQWQRSRDSICACGSRLECVDPGPREGRAGVDNTRGANQGKHFTGGPIPVHDLSTFSY